MARPELCEGRDGGAGHLQHHPHQTAPPVQFRFTQRHKGAKKFAEGRAWPAPSLPKTKKGRAAPGPSLGNALCTCMVDELAERGMEITDMLGGDRAAVEEIGRSCAARNGITLPPL